MKKTLKVLLSIAIILTIFTPKKILALDEHAIIEEELKIAILSGDGSDENPYVIDPTLAPVFYEYLRQSGEQIIETLTSKSDSSLGSPRVLEGILSGNSYSSQTNGGRWKRSSGGMNVIYNGSIKVNQVNYIGYNDTVNLKAGFSNVTAKKIFEDIWDEIYQDPYSSAIEKLIKEGIKKTWAAPMVKWLGFAGSAYSYGVIAAEISLFFQQKPYNDAVNQKKGVIHAEYDTAYQGSWYATSLTEVWSNYPTAKMPSTTYGKGTYISDY